MPTPRQGYYIDGERVPSVTQVLGITAFTPSDALCGWADKTAKAPLRALVEKWEKTADGIEQSDARGDARLIELDARVYRGCAAAARKALAQGNWRELRSRLGMVGSCIHDAIEGIPNLPLRDAGDNAKLDDDEWLRVMTAWEAHSEWVERRRPKIALQEMQLLSKDLRAGGTPDQVLRVGEGEYLTDHKSGKSIGAKEVAQLAAYAHMVKEVLGRKLDGAIIFHHPAPDSPAGKVYIRETGKPFRAIPLAPSTLEKGLRAFRAARELYDVAGELKAAVGVEEL